MRLHGAREADEGVEGHGAPKRTQALPSFTVRKLQEASKALTNAQARIRAAEDQVTAFEFRAQSAEANLHEAKQALVQVEEAIRERLLSQKRSSIEAQHDLASPSENG